MNQNRSNNMFSNLICGLSNQIVPASLMVLALLIIGGSRPHSGSTPEAPTATAPSPVSSLVGHSVTAPNSTSTAMNGYTGDTPSPGPPSHPDVPIHTYHALGSVITQAATPWYASVVQSPTVSSVGTATGPVVAVIDTGFALNHIGLNGHWYTNPGEIGSTTIEGPTPNCTSRGLALDKSCNNVDNDGDGYRSNWRGWDFVNNDNDPQTGLTNAASTSAFHGTFVAGIIGANASGNVGGIDPNARILPIQALDDNGDGNTFTVGDAVRYAADHGAQIINLSLGSSDDDSYLNTQIDYARAKGIVVIAAAGNDGCNCMSYPANHAGVLGVGATDQQDLRATFSSYGSGLGMVAPGTNICSTYWTSPSPNSLYACGGAGTSFSAPMVSATVGLIMQQTGISAARALQAVTISADKVPAMLPNARSDQFGIGRLDIAEALNAASSPHYSIGGNLAMGVNCPDATTSCSFAIQDQYGETAVIMAQKTGTSYSYTAPDGTTIEPGIEAFIPIPSQKASPRIYFTFDP